MHNKWQHRQLLGVPGGKSRCISDIRVAAEALLVHEVLKIIPDVVSCL